MTLRHHNDITVCTSGGQPACVNDFGSIILCCLCVCHPFHNAERTSGGREGCEWVVRGGRKKEEKERGGKRRRKEEEREGKRRKEKEREGKRRKGEKERGGKREK